AVEEDIKRLREISPSLYRHEYLENVDAVQNWIDSTYPENNLIVKHISIPCTPPPNQKKKNLNEVYGACFRASETKMHGYLKWFSYCYLSKGCASYFHESYGISFEVKYFLPGNRLIKEYKGGKGRVIPKSWSPEWSFSSC